MAKRGGDSPPISLESPVNPELLPAQDERCLTTTAVDLLTVGRDIHSGLGMVDTVEALRCANNLRAAAVVPPTTPVPPAAPPAPANPPSAAPLPATGTTPLLPLAGLAVLGAAALVRRRLS